MKRLVGVIAALTMGLVGAPVSAAECCETEFDWAQPYYEAFERHGIGYLAHEVGIPVINEADLVCRGKTSREDIQDVGNHWQGGRRLTNAEVEKVIAAANDVCPGAVR